MKKMILIMVAAATLVTSASADTGNEIVKEVTALNTIKNDVLIMQQKAADLLAQNPDSPYFKMVMSDTDKLIDAINFAQQNSIDSRLGRK